MSLLRKQLVSLFSWALFLVAIFSCAESGPVLGSGRTQRVDCGFYIVREILNVGEGHKLRALVVLPDERFDSQDMSQDGSEYMLAFSSTTSGVDVTVRFDVSEYPRVVVGDAEFTMAGGLALLVDARSSVSAEVIDTSSGNSREVLLSAAVDRGMCDVK